MNDDMSEAKYLDSFYEGDEDYDGEEQVFSVHPTTRDTVRQLLTQQNSVATTQKQDMIAAYNSAKAAKVGTTIKCPCCMKSFVKTTYHKTFCSNGKTHKGKSSCKDQYHNIVNETRAQRAEQYR